MTWTTMAKDEATSAVREEFSKLSLDGKTSFLVEAVFSTAGTAIHEIGERLTSLVDLVTGSAEASHADEPSEAESPQESPDEKGDEKDAGRASK